jgi:hypothetical protein
LGIKIYQIDYQPDGNFGFTYLGGADTPGSAYDADLTRDRRHLVIADYQKVIQVMDVSDRTNPLLVGSLELPNVNQVFRIWVQGDTAYVLDKYRGIHAADVSNPAEPRHIAFFDTPGPSGLYVTPDQTVYLTDVENGLYILRWK